MMRFTDSCIQLAESISTILEPHVCFLAQHDGMMLLLHLDQCAQKIFQLLVKTEGQQLDSWAKTSGPCWAVWGDVTHEKKKKKDKKRCPFDLVICIQPHLHPAVAMTTDVVYYLADVYTELFLLQERLWLFFFFFKRTFAAPLVFSDWLEKWTWEAQCRGRVR